jgi:hypothetical protein
VVRRLLITLVWPLFRHVRTACGIAQSRQTTRGPHARGWEQPRLHVTVQLEGPRRLPRGLRLSHEWPKPPLRCLQMAANLNVLGDRRRACECAPAGYAGIRDIMDHQTQGRAPPGGGAAAANVTSESSRGSLRVSGPSGHTQLLFATVGATQVSGPSTFHLGLRARFQEPNQRFGLSVGTHTQKKDLLSARMRLTH